MNQFLRLFFNVPNASLLNLFSPKDEKSKETEDELFTRIQVITKCDILKFVKDVLNDVGEEDLQACLHTASERLNEEYGMGKFDCMRFLVFQLWLILEGTHYKGSHRIADITVRYDEFRLNTTENGLQENATKYAKNNFLNYLLASEDVLSCLKEYTGGMRLNEGHKYFNNSYSDAYSEMRASAILCGVSDMYREKFQMIPDKGKKQRKYSARTINTFLTQYNSYMEYIKTRHKVKNSREEKLHEYSELSFDAMNYFIEMLYMFNLFDKTASNSIKENLKLEEGFLERFLKCCTELFMIPDIDRRMYYADRLWNQIKEIEKYDKIVREEIQRARILGNTIVGHTKEGDDYSKACEQLKKVITSIRYDATIYYPLLTLVSITLVREYTKKYGKGQQPYEYIIKQLKCVYEHMSPEERNIELEYKFSRYAGKIPYTCYGLYDKIRKKYFSTDKFEASFGRKITFESADYFGMMFAYLTFAYSEIEEDVDGNGI